MKHFTFALLSLAVWASAEELPVYYDYVEEGQLRGGRIVIDPSDPEVRAIFGLDPPGTSVPWAVTTIINNGPTANRIDLVMLGDGYTIAELDEYADHVENVLEAFFVEEPLGAYATYFNVHRVEVISAESGVDEPDYGIYRDTALDMRYYCNGIPRLLCINVSKAGSAAHCAPDADQALALANSTRYGGAGYPWANLGTLAGNNYYSVEIALHEFGHSFANLADEYDYGGDLYYTGPEPAEANVSIYDANAQMMQQRKWYRWINHPHVDTFEGAYYHRFDIYRPTWNSKMRSLNRPFQEVNVEQFVILLYQTVSPIDDVSPDPEEPLNRCSAFVVDPLEPTDHALDIQWSLDGVVLPGAADPTFMPDYSALLPGTHQVAVRVVDNTTRVRDQTARSTWMTDTREWQFVAESCCLPGGACTVSCGSECSSTGGYSPGTAVVCEGDHDGDGYDGACGDWCPTDPFKLAPGFCGCLVAETDTDGDGAPDCIDDCPLDPHKTRPGICGCGVDDHADGDGDSVPDCIDQCKGVDDAVFAPGCLQAIPTVSVWGIVILTLLLMTAAKVYFSRTPQRH